ncbi:MAG: penicillin-binding transpeptidase domain-containing protein [Gammaproteobacteria bacterium]|nr:penicillin-binding transpeptidase domain-containing protein [Gammaproteobacteria bacterium]
MGDDNKILYEAAPQQAQQVITAQNAYLITQGMRGVIQSGTAEAAKSLNRTDLAGKTGTTNDQVDAWFSGFNSNILATVWVGFDNSNDSLREYGAQAALPIWMQFMKAALAGQPEATMAQPADIVTARINPETGLLASAKEKNAITEVFQKEDMPKQYASNTQPVTLHGVSGAVVANSGGHVASGEDIF